MDVAVQLQKISLGQDRYFFKPVSVIRGKYHESSDDFDLEHGDTIDNVEGCSGFEDFYFAAPATMEELKKAFGDLEEKELIREYYNSSYDYIYFGIYNPAEDIIETVPISMADFEDILYSQEDEEIEPEIRVTLTKEALQALKNINSAKEYHNQIDNVIGVLDKYKSDLELTAVDDVETKSKNNKSSNITLKDLKKEVKSNIIAQDEAVDIVTTAVMVNKNSKNPRHKSHVLIAGPSGTGKTEMINVICKKLDIPFFAADATAYTQEGYVGKSVYSMLESLIDAADGDVEKAENGILVIDEIDKKVIDNNSVSGTAVLNSLLKMMDRTVLEIECGEGMFKKNISFNTSNLTIIFMGAFAELYKKKVKKELGFGSNIEGKVESTHLENEDFVKFGVPMEFMGRIGTIAYTKDLSVEDLTTILYKSKISPIKEEREFFNDLGVKVTFSNDFLKEIAIEGHKTGTGARSLKKLVHKSLTYVYEDVLSDSSIKTLKLTKETVHDNKKYCIK